MIRVDVKGGPAAMKRLSAELGEDTKTAVARLAVSMGRECATQSLPFGNTRKQIQGAITRDAKRAIMPVSARYFNDMAKDNSPSIQEHGVWKKVRRHQLLRGEAEVDRKIDRERNPIGQVPIITFERRGITRKSTLNTVMTRRRKEAGKAKGGWIGAGKAAGRIGRARGLTIGKNFMSWAQKHSDQGSARQVQRGRKMLLVNRASSARRALTGSGVKKAFNQAWRKTGLWYRRAIKRTRR